MIRVVLADDHGVVRHGLRTLIEAEPDLEVAAEVDDGARVAEVVLATKPHVLVLDLSFPGHNGFDIIKRVQATGVTTAIVVLSLHPEGPMALHLMREGAAAYLSKSRPPAEVITAIRKAASGARHLTDTLQDLALMGKSIDGPPHMRFTPRESQVFFLLLDGKTVSEIAAELDLSLPTVSNHIAALKDKVGAASVIDLVHYAWRSGLVE